MWGNTLYTEAENCQHGQAQCLTPIKYKDMEYKDGKIVIRTFEELIDVILNASPEQLDGIYQMIDEEIERQEKHDEDEIIRQELSN